MKILFVASEATPLAKVGGLADVTGSLPKELHEHGHDIRVIIPKYGFIDDIKLSWSAKKHDFKVFDFTETQSVVLKMTELENRVIVYMIENSKYFGGKKIYDDKNDLERFFFFSKSVFTILPKLEWQPEIIHCHDWHTSLIIMWLREAKYPCATIFTIHNLAYQGNFDEFFLNTHNLKKYWVNHPPDAPALPFNFMVQGIVGADLVTTVSKSYAREIVTPTYGEGLDSILNYIQKKKSLIGILNGIDYEEYNPQTDPYITANYGPLSLDTRVKNKLALQREMGFPESARIPVVGMVQRLDEQKGFDILEKAIAPILNETEIQLVVLGQGREKYEHALAQIVSKYPQRVSLSTNFNDPLAHRIYAGCDIFLMPSRFEPCGLGQLIAMRYGALPVVRHTGGLIDTVPKLTSNLANGNGFVFRDYSPEALIHALNEAVNAYINNREAWQQAMRRVMCLDFSWHASALKFESIYKNILKSKK